MRLTAALPVIALTLLALGCSRQEEEEKPALERAQEKLDASLAKLEDKLAEGTEKAKEALAVAARRWEELRPEAERAVAKVEERLEQLAKDSEALKHLPPDALDRARAHLKAMREKLAEAKEAREQGHAEIAVEKADEIQEESAAVEELLVERPDSPGR